MEYTVAQGLKKLKLIEKKLTNELNMGYFLGLKQVSASTEAKTRLKVDDFSVKAKASKNSIEQLIENFYKLNGAIAVSNATTMVRVGNKEYTVAEAIKRKNNIDKEKSFLQKLINTKDKIEKEVEIKNQRNKDEMNEAISRDSDKKDKLIDFYNGEKWEIVDPLKIDELIKKMSDDIDTFESEVDDCLSTSNIKTIIKVDFEI